MENIINVYKTQERVKIPGKLSKIDNFLKVSTYVIVAVIIIGSLIFGENLFFEISWAARILLIGLIIKVFLLGPKASVVPSEIELRFYDNYLIVYREKRFYSHKTSRMEYCKFLYKDIEGCDYDMRTKRLNITGIVEDTWFDYNKDGSVPNKPTFHKTTNSITYFYVYGEDYKEIITVLERFIGKKVEVINLTEE